MFATGVINSFFTPEDFACSRRLKIQSNNNIKYGWMCHVCVFGELMVWGSGNVKRGADCRMLGEGEKVVRIGEVVTWIGRCGSMKRERW